MTAASRRRDRSPSLVVSLVAAVAFHGALLLAGSYQRTYDAWVHIFFADHYRRDWFSSWEPRWYTGFTVVSYPPGAHQLVGLLSRLFGLRGAFVVVQLAAILVAVVGIYRFSKLWVSPRDARWAALLFAFSSSIAETVHVFGQLPTMMAIGLLLNSLPFAYRFVTEGDVAAGLTGAALAAATTAGHHVTTLFGSVFFLGPVLVAALLERFRRPLDGENGGRSALLDRHTLLPVVARRLRRVLPATMRAVIYGSVVIAGLVIVVLPYWLWSRRDPISQISIPHASRDSFIENPNAGLVFWLVPWGIMLLALPYAIVRSSLTRAWPLVASLSLLTLLGTGGTTPIPRMLLGGAFDILTLDRFTFWATMMILPIAGRMAASIVDGNLQVWLRNNLGQGLATCVTGALGVAVVLMSLFSANLTHYRAFQPARIDPTPIVNFMEKDEHWRWRYLMLGFGDQMAWISGQMTAMTVDGNYHSARRLPELTATTVERLEGAKYSGVPGLGSLQQFIASPETYHLKYVFSNDKFYDPLLAAAGWRSLGFLENGIAAWERADIEPMPPDLIDHEIPFWQRRMWGLLPLTAVFGALLLTIVRALVSRRYRIRVRMPAWYRPIDRLLAREAAKINTGQFVQRQWQWGTTLRHVVGKLRRPVSVRCRRRQAAALIVSVAAVFGALSFRTQNPDSPTAVVAKFYAALDIRAFSDAYAMLNPETRPSFDSFRMDQLFDGGLVGSYSKLDSVEAAVISEGNPSVVEAKLSYLTALDLYRVKRQVTVRKVGRQWWIEVPPVDRTQPPQRIVDRVDVDYLTLERNRVSRRDGRDILDRPRLKLGEAKLVRLGERWAVIGDVTNIDADPADVTVWAEMRDTDGELLVMNFASFVMHHDLLPQETTPFRIDLETVGGYAEERLEFDPKASWPFVLPPGTAVGSVDVYARAVTSDRPMDRSLRTVDAEFDPATSNINGAVYNDGTKTVAVPHLLLTYRTSDGSAIWVDHSYLEASVGPQRSSTFSVETAAEVLDRIEVVDVALRRFDNSEASTTVAPTASAAGRLELADDDDRSVELTVVGML